MFCEHPGQGVVKGVWIQAVWGVGAKGVSLGQHRKEEVTGSVLRTC